MVPFQNVDRKGFKEMIKTLDPRYALHARTDFSQIEMAKLYGNSLANARPHLNVDEFCR
jgi:hypothetical protein